jgi:hypothetical protein
MIQGIPTVGVRLSAMLIDHLAMTFISAFGAVLIFGPCALAVYRLKPLDLDLVNSIGVFLGSLVLSLHVNKDILHGQSVAKRQLGLQGVDLRTDHVATPVQYVLRDLALLIWPREVLVNYYSPTRRIADRMAGTQVVLFDPMRSNLRAGKANSVAAIVAVLALAALTPGLILGIILNAMHKTGGPTGSAKHVFNAATFKSLATQQIQPWVHTLMVVWTHESRAFPNMIPWK